VADVAYPALDPSRTPASLSRPIMTDLLRGQLGFQGVIITDDLGMAAISQKPGDAAVAAIAAGADIVMFADTPDKQQQAYDAIVAAVRSGKLSEDQINKSVERILDMKKKYRLERPEASAGINTGTSTGAGGQ
jgi:beta-N-acetylhexosaminidase